MQTISEFVAPSGMTTKREKLHINPTAPIRQNKQYRRTLSIISPNTKFPTMSTPSGMHYQQVLFNTSSTIRKPAVTKSKPNLVCAMPDAIELKALDVPWKSPKYTANSQNSIGNSLTLDNAIDSVLGIEWLFCLSMYVNTPEVPKHRRARQTPIQQPNDNSPVAWQNFGKKIQFSIEPSLRLETWAAMLKDKKEKCQKVELSSKTTMGCQGNSGLLKQASEPILYKLRYKW
eukprot:TRINITY_DN4748_c0_g1_i1.p2 TRINITY_DN4748_c0_g1~~TRINITY_DN4748_c0_g1_i1.p2  ORF type:complete len:231 (-),score=0.68 TRINITY_DN4748_c0_g1_i1:518-1210(-)